MSFQKKSLVCFFTICMHCFFYHHAMAQSIYNKLVWSDEFNTPGMPDTSKWSYDAGNGCPQNCGWGNKELQYYAAGRKENSRVENGNLIIEARKEIYEGSSFSSARLVSKNKGDWKYGRFEARIKIPAGTGVWPAFWMLPTNWEYGGWPRSGEIDIMENVGFMPDSVFATVHTGAYNGMLGTQKTKGLMKKDLSTAFHVYALEWSPEVMRFFIDGQLCNEFKNEKTGIEAWPFDKEFHVLFNIAIGGNWGGQKGVDAKIFPQKMEVDYVRVYQ